MSLLKFFFHSHFVFKDWKCVIFVEHQCVESICRTPVLAKRVTGIVAFHGDFYIWCEVNGLLGYEVLDFPCLHQSPD